MYLFEAVDKTSTHLADELQKISMLIKLLEKTLMTGQDWMAFGKPKIKPIRVIHGEVEFAFGILRVDLGEDKSGAILVVVRQELKAKLGTIKFKISLSLASRNLSNSFSLLLN